MNLYRIGVATQDSCAILGPVCTLGPELHVDLSALQCPVLHLDGFPLSTGPKLHMDMSGQL